MELDYTLVKFKDIDLRTREGVKLRGYFARKYQDNVIMHNHKDGNFIFTYPKIQYKVIKNTPYLCGIAEGAAIAARVGIDTDEIMIDRIELSTYEKEIMKHKAEFGLETDYMEYSFLTPWMALNQENYISYKNSNHIQKEEILKKILAGNILSMSKGVNYTVRERINTWFDLNEVYVKFKNIDMIAFKGIFRVNFRIPDYLGLGKAVSRGFGTVIKIK